MTYSLNDFKEVEYTEVPKLVSSFSAGAGTPFSDGETTLSVSKNFIKNAKNPYLITVKGDSMLPLLHSGDLVVIDFNKRAKSGNIVAVHLNGDILIKRFCENTQGYKLESINQEYKTIEIQDDDQFLILGVAISFKRDFN
jgi:SOS-response transcriptional repressor LexA